MIINKVYAFSEEFAVSFYYKDLYIGSIRGEKHIYHFDKYSPGFKDYLMNR